MQFDPHFIQISFGTTSFPPLIILILGSVCIITVFEGFGKCEISELWNSSVAVRETHLQNTCFKRVSCAFIKS